MKPSTNSEKQSDDFEFFDYNVTVQARPSGNDLKIKTLLPAPITQQSYTLETFDSARGELGQQTQNMKVLGKLMSFVSERRRYYEFGLDLFN